MQRQVWTLSEIKAILQALALAGADVKTLAMIAIALGLKPGLGDRPGDKMRPDSMDIIDLQSLLDR